MIGVEAGVWHTKEVASWTLDKGPFRGKAEATSVWGTERRPAGELIEDALNQAIPQIWDTWRDENGEHRQLNAQETEATKEKLAAIKTAFQTWVWQDPERAERLVRLYNDTYNNLVPRAFDGSHLQLPGASTTIQLRAHQKRVVWRIIATGNTYMAHAVGSGKTFSMCAAIMEQRRLGLISKAMVVVPGHCLAQMAREFLMLYPTAKILVADETNFVKATRTELELQPSGLYKPVTRFAEFVNMADLMAMYRHFADVVQQDDLRQYVKLPEIATGSRQIVVADSGPAFRDYQKELEARIKVIEERKGKPEKGQDIILSVINDEPAEKPDLVVPQELVAMQAAMGGRLEILRV